jgi:hypothetical protein
MLKQIKPSLGCIYLLLLLQAIALVTRAPFLFTSAKNNNGVRGLDRSNRIPNGVLPERDLQGKNKNNKDNKDKNDKRKDNRDGVAKIETTPASPNTEEDSGRDEIESPVTSTDSLWSLENSTEVTPEVTAESANATSAPMDVGTPSEPLEIEYDTSKFLAGEQLEPIIFNMNVKKYTSVMNHDILTAHIQEFLEDVLDMKSNSNWFPFHSKSMHNISVELFPGIAVVDENHEGKSQDRAIAVQLVVNGLVLVHANEREGAVISKKRNADGAKEHTQTSSDKASRSKFQDSFDHSMLLYFTFWGVDSLQKVLEEDGGLQKPVIGSVVVGEKQLITFGTDKDDNYKYEGDHDASSKPKRPPAKAISDVGKESSASATKYGSLTLMIAALGSIIC